MRRQHKSFVFEYCNSELDEILCLEREAREVELKALMGWLMREELHCHPTHYDAIRSCRKRAALYLAVSSSVGNLMKSEG